MYVFLFKNYILCMNLKYFVNALYAVRKIKVGPLGDRLVIMNMKALYFVAFNKIKIILS